MTQTIGNVVALDHVAERVTNLRAWLDELETMAAELLDRPEAPFTAGEEPLVRPCEHRLEWDRDGCLACGDSGWRPCRHGEPGIDPYAADLRRSLRGARTPVDAIVDSLQQDAYIRTVAETQEERELRCLQSLGAKKVRTARRVLHGLWILRERFPAWYGRLPEDYALLLLSEVCYRYAPGAIRPPR